MHLSALFLGCSGEASQQVAINGVILSRVGYRLSLTPIRCLSRSTDQARIYYEKPASLLKTVRQHRRVGRYALRTQSMMSDTHRDTLRLLVRTLRCIVSRLAASVRDGMRDAEVRSHRTATPGISTALPIVSPHRQRSLSRYASTGHIKRAVMHKEG